MTAADRNDSRSMHDSSGLQESCPLLSVGLLPRMHYQQVRDAWYGMRTPDGR
jgi:hypothetical protein